MAKPPTIEYARRFLKKRGWLSRTPPEFAEKLLSRCTLKTAERSTSVYRLGDPPDGIRGVVSGGFAFEIAPHERGPNLAHMFRPGFWFGEAETFDGRPKIATIFATRATVYVHVANKDLFELAQEYPETWRWLGQLGGDHLVLALGVIDDATWRNPDNRIAAILLRLADVRNEDKPEDPHPELDVTQSDLAHLATVSRATVANKLDALEREQLIRCTYGCITILQAARIRERLTMQIFSDP